MDIGKMITGSWKLTIKNIGVVVAAMIIAILLGGASLGILCPALMAGVMMLYVKAKRGKKIAIPQVFDYLKLTVRLLLATLWVWLLIAVGLCLLIVPGLIFAAWWMYTPLFIADRNMKIGDAMRASKELTRKYGLGMSILLGFIVVVLAGAGKVVFMVGALFTTPLAIGTLVHAYDGKRR